MIFRQLFDSVSGTYTYLIASRHGGEALIIDPVLEKVDRYLQLLRELDLKLVKAVDTHLHADHITGLGALRDRTRCVTVMGQQTRADVVSMRVTEGECIEIEGLSLDVLYTPGHTDDSYSFLMGDRVFTGDTLLIRGTGRTDFQSGDARAQYDSIFGKLLKLPRETLVYPAHDYKGDTVGGSSDLTSQDHKLAFLNGNVDRRTVSPDRVDAPASPFVLQAGAVIPAALLTGLRSDLPGQVTAQVTEDVYDSPTGRILLIPQGARLVGQYDAQIAFGQSRALLAWTRLIMPNGRSIVLERQPGADPEGYAGLEDEVDNHWGMLFKAAILSTLLSVGSEAAWSADKNVRGVPGQVPPVLVS